MYRVDQGILLSYHDNVEPRTCDVMQLPDRFIMSNVRLPATVGWQTKPLINSIVLVVSPDDYKSFLICTLRDPENFLQLGEGVRGATAETSNFLQPGEIQLESAGTGDSTDVISGSGSSLYLANDGTVNLYSGKRKEFLLIGGTESDDDGEVILTGDNGFFESNINHVTQVRSTFNFDETNNLALGNYNVIVPPTGTEISTPISELTMTTLGKTVLRNTTAGVTNSLLEMDVDGKVTLSNTLGTLIISNVGAYSFSNSLGSFSIANTGNISLQNVGTTLTALNAGAVSLNAASLAVSTSGTTTITGSTINLNSGTFGAARLNDIVTSNLTTDPAFWTFWSTIAIQIAALPTTPLDGGATLKAGLATLFGLMPQTILSKITTASSTVKVGG